MGPLYTNEGAETHLFFYEKLMLILFMSTSGQYKAYKHSIIINCKYRKDQGNGGGSSTFGIFSEVE